MSLLSQGMHLPSGEINGDEELNGKVDEVADLNAVNPLLIFVLHVESVKMPNSMAWVVNEQVAPIYPENVALVVLYWPHRT